MYPYVNIQVYLYCMLQHWIFSILFDFVFMSLLQLYVNYVCLKVFSCIMRNILICMVLFDLYEHPLHRSKTEILTDW